MAENPLYANSEDDSSYAAYEAAQGFPQSSSQPSNNTGGSNGVNTVLPGGNGNIGGTNFTVPNIGAIGSNLLTPQSPTPYVTPAPSPIPNITSLSPYYNASTDSLTETPEEDAMSKLSTYLEGLNNEDAGKAADTTAEENAAGIPQLTSTQTDLASQLTSLQDQAKAIPQQLQSDAEGRGITANGLSSIQSAAIRNNSVQALTVSAMIDANNGLIASATTKVNNAIAAKYGPIEAQITAAQNNLQLIANDPQTSIDDKNRATAQADALAQKAAAVATAKQNATDVMNAAISASKNGADAATLQKMQSAPDGATALQIAVVAGYGTSNVQDLSTKYPDAGIQPGDSLQDAQAKVMKSPSYTLAQKSAMLDVATKEQALATAAANDSPENISNAVQSLNDYAGIKYYTSTDLEGMDPKAKQAFITAAKSGGAQPLTPKNADALSSIQAAKDNLSSFSQFLSSGILPSTGGVFGIGAKPGQIATVTLNNFFQQNPQLGSFQTWQAQVVNLVSALRGAGSGGGGASRLIGTISAMLPVETDTIQVAQQKIQNINTILDNNAASVLNISPIQLQATSAGYDYQAMIAAGYTDQDIQQALASSTQQ